MKIKFSIAILVGLPLTALAAAAGTNKFLQAKKAEMFASAKPASQVPFLTDKDGCLYGIVDGGGRLTTVAILGDDKKPLCKPN